MFDNFESLTISGSSLPRSDCCAANLWAQRRRNPPCLRL